MPECQRRPPATSFFGQVLSTPSEPLDGVQGHDLIRTSIHDKYSGSMQITTHLDHISHC